MMQTRASTDIPRPAHDAGWQDTYAQMIATPKQAVARIRPGQRVFVGTGCAQPQELVQALTDRSSELPDTEIDRKSVV
jgi:acyl-CoA hydrolase